MAGTDSPSRKRSRYRSYSLLIILVISSGAPSKMLQRLAGGTPHKILTLATGDEHPRSLRERPPTHTMPRGRDTGSRPLWPMYTAGRGGFDSPSPRWCVQHWKASTLLRIEADMTNGGELWFPVPFDEWMRVRASTVPEVIYRYPLVEQKITRAMCEAEFPDAPPSHCQHCAFQSDAQWKALKAKPDAFGEVVVRELQQGWREDRGYFHPSLKPLSEVEFDNHPGTWNAECWGLCAG